MAKERQELEQRVDALTDALTGLLNRRALFEVTDALGQDRQLGGAAISVLIFDLDHFKETNDRFGHACAQAVCPYSIDASQWFECGRTARRRGVCRHFAGADPLEAFGAGEAVRRAFANSAAFVDGLAVGAKRALAVGLSTKTRPHWRCHSRYADAVPLAPSPDVSQARREPAPERA
jgi:hypothetical protein